MSRLTRADAERFEAGIAAAVADARRAPPVDLTEHIRAIVREEIARALAAHDAAAAPELVTIAEYARARSISESTVRAAIREGRLEIVRFGRTGRAVRIRRDAQIAAPLRRPGPNRTTAAARRLGLQAVP